METTTIEVTKKQKEELEKLKKVAQEPVKEVIERLLAMHKKEEPKTP